MGFDGPFLRLFLICRGNEPVCSGAIGAPVSDENGPSTLVKRASERRANENHATAAFTRLLRHELVMAVFHDGPANFARIRRETVRGSA